MSTSKLGDKQPRHELAHALAEGYRYDPANKPPLRPGCTVRLNKIPEGPFQPGQMVQSTLVRIESEDDVTTLKQAMEELINGKD